MELDYIETHLVDHCNLNCRGCSHFSPLSEKKFTAFNTLKENFLRLKQLFDNISVIILMGGEPLLYPDLSIFLQFTRSLFPKSIISILTNGTLLLRQEESFWETCRRNNILIKITKYPIKLDFESIRNAASNAGVNIEISDQISHFYKYLNLEGNSDPILAFKECQSVYRCPHLRDGKIYKCRTPALIHLFNKRFEKNIPVCESDFLSIHSNTSGLDILKFLNTPSPICSWCLTDWPTFKWQLTKKKINEWANFHPFEPHAFCLFKKTAAKKSRVISDTMWRLTIKSKRLGLGRSTGSIIANPNQIVVSASHGVGVTELMWTSQKAKTVEVHIDAPDGPLFSQSGPSGSAKTGKWVRDGQLFYLQDVSDGLPLSSDNTIDRIRVNVIRERLVKE